MRNIVLVVLTLVLVAGGLFTLDKVQRGEPLDFPWSQTSGSKSSAPDGTRAPSAPSPPPPPAQTPEPEEQAGSGTAPGASQPEAPPADPKPAEREPIERKSDAPGSAGLPPPPPAAPAGGEAPPPPADEAANTDWDIVPVYYGTDRAVEPNDKRRVYGAGRGRRLELGRALVTVPKAHVIPSIERPWAIRVPYLNVTLYEQAEDPKTHFTMKEVRALKEDEFLEFVRVRLQKSSRFKDHALIFIHGYNTSFDFAVYRAAQIAYDLEFDGAAFAYSWPSGGGLSSYTYDRESSGQAQPFLKEFITLVASKTGAKSVSIIAHSMGNGPTLEVLRDLKLQRPAGVEISQIILAAPDVDRDNFENIAAEIKGLAKGVTLYAAANDRALRVSRNFYGGIPRAGDVPQTGPLVVPGVDTIDVTAASTEAFSLNHSGYAENNLLLKDIGILIEAGTRPPKLRTPSLDVVPTPAGDYWRYPKSP